MRQYPPSISYLPLPEREAAAHGARVIEYLRAEIARSGGSMPFMRFMELALYAPGLGYYNAGSRKFGSAGDFVTAPELSSLFSRCVARQCWDILHRLEGGDILEVGAGSGVMAADILLELEALASLPNRYYILELSGELRERQQILLQQRLPHLLDRVLWLETLPEFGFRGIIVGNEVLDAMPVRRFRITAHDPLCMHVAWEGDGFIWREQAGDGELAKTLDILQTELGFALPVGYESEYSPWLDGWLKSLSGVLRTGALLLIDYGYSRREYYHPERNTGTLICHYRHRCHNDPLILPGLQDITASVDFTAVADAAVAAGLEVAGYTSQNHFLLGCGLADMLAQGDPADRKNYMELTRQTKLLTLPGEMGDRFKAIALTRGLDISLRGFGFLDERKRL